MQDTYPGPSRISPKTCIGASHMGLIIRSKIYLNIEFSYRHSILRC